MIIQPCLMMVQLWFNCKQNHEVIIAVLLWGKKTRHTGTEMHLCLLVTSTSFVVSYILCCCFFIFSYSLFLYLIQLTSLIFSTIAILQFFQLWLATLDKATLVKRKLVLFCNYNTDNKKMQIQVVYDPNIIIHLMVNVRCDCLFIPMDKKNILNAIILFSWKHERVWSFFTFNNFSLLPQVIFFCFMKWLRDVHIKSILMSFCFVLLIFHLFSFKWHMLIFQFKIMWSKR